MSTEIPTIHLPGERRELRSYRMHPPADFPLPVQPLTSRRCFAAPHTVVDARAEYTPGVLPPVDWDATIAFRLHLWRYGIGVAEAMDTTERGRGGLSWPQAQELIRRSLEAARNVDGAIVCGAGTDQLPPGPATLSAIADAYMEQLAFIEDLGGSAIIRVSHALAEVARGSDDYLEVYGRVLAASRRPVIVHWLGTVFDPQLRNYWGEQADEAAMKVVLQLVKDHADSLEGIKFSLLNATLEEALRGQLPVGIRVYTGDDYDYPRLLLGGRTYSHAVLGVLDPIAPIASLALQHLDAGGKEAFLDTMESTVPLAVRMFEEPAAMYKTGCVFLAYLSGHQDHFRMVSGREGMRSVRHLSDLFVLADELGLFPDPALTAHRMKNVLALSGIE